MQGSLSGMYSIETGLFFSTHVHCSIIVLQNNDFRTQFHQLKIFDDTFTTRHVWSDAFEMLANYLKRSKSCSKKIRCILKLNLFQLVEGLRKHSSFLEHDKAAFSALRIVCVCHLIASLCRVFFFSNLHKKVYAYRDL